jgi:RHS repeat-associated protein
MHSPRDPENRIDARESDTETGLYYYRARYYDFTTGRFWSEDLEGFSASPNFYSYVDNDPIDWTDPAGLDKVEVCCRPLRKLKPLLIFRIWHHFYIKITDPAGTTDTWGVLPGDGGERRIRADRQDSRASGSHHELRRSGG